MVEYWYVLMFQDAVFNCSVSVIMKSWISIVPEIVQLLFLKIAGRKVYWFN